MGLKFETISQSPRSIANKFAESEGDLKPFLNDFQYMKIFNIEYGVFTFVWVETRLY